MLRNSDALQGINCFPDVLLLLSSLLKRGFFFSIVSSIDTYLSRMVWPLLFQLSKVERVLSEADKYQVSKLFLFQILIVSRGGEEN